MCFIYFEWNFNSSSICIQLGCVPGSAFGTKGEGYLRFSFAANPKHIQRAAEIIMRL